MGSEIQAMLGILRTIAERFEKKTAAIEAKAARLEESARHSDEQTERINRETEGIRQETEDIRQETSQMFNALVAEIATAMENARTAEEREMFRHQAAQLHRAFTLN